MENTTTNAVDKSGRILLLGDLIVYGHAIGRSAALRYGKILRVNAAKLDVYGRLASPTLTVWGVNDDGAEWDPDLPPTLLSKSSTLSYPRRVQKIPDGCVPPAVLALLLSVQVP